MTLIRSLEFKEEKLHIINQTLLPLNLEYIITDDYNRIASAIERLEVRGAPAIGIAAAYALALSVKKSEKEPKSDFYEAYNRLIITRPTAVNLFYALNMMKDLFDRSSGRMDIYNVLISKAIEIHEDDIEMCRSIGVNGQQILKKKSAVLTHCNTGALATGGDGTALSVIKRGYENGLVEFVYVDETRPLFQGSRLTAWELNRLGIPFKIIADSTAAVLMKEGNIDLIITGADRIALNGDAANKIGTYHLSVLALHHKIPFYIAAPSTTIDFNSKTGSEFKIELRNKMELFEMNGCHITSSEYDAFCPAFDVTPNQYITSIITEKSVHYPPYRFENV
ncbi:MAG TPA: S-methyl-5-thioribose-1-phosphate isomerase [Melioribacteraceae bacterium]|nr:S-methyl-5-thioribose-1-phosphate isomerase [Melioribacteraceae bacterium]